MKMLAWKLSHKSSFLQKRPIQAFTPAKYTLFLKWLPNSLTHWKFFKEPECSNQTKKMLVSTSLKNKNQDEYFKCIFFKTTFHKYALIGEKHSINCVSSSPPIIFEQQKPTKEMWTKVLVSRH